MADQRFAIDAVFRAIDQITSPTRRMARNVGRFADRMSRKLNQVNGVLKKIGSGAARVGKAVLVAGAVAAAAFTHAIDVGAEYEQVLINAGTRLGDIRRGTAAFDELSAAAVSMSSKTEFGAKDAAGALLFMGTASESAAVAMGTLDIFADSATAGKVELSRAAFIAADSIGSMGLAVDENNKKLSDTDKIANYVIAIDLMTAAHSGANLTLENVFETTKNSAKNFLDAGQSLETFFAAMQVVAPVKKGSEAATQMNIVLKNLLKTTGESAKAMKTLRNEAGKKIKLADKFGNIRPLADILEDVNFGLNRFNELKREQTKQLIFGEGKKVGAALLAGVDELREKELKLQSVRKITEKLASRSRDSAKGAFQTLASTIEAIEIGVFDIIRDDVVKITKAVTAWAVANKGAFGEAVNDSLTFLHENFERLVSTGLRIATFVAVLWTLSKVLTAISTLMAIIATLTVVTAGTMGLIVIAVVAVIAVLALFVIFWDDIMDAAVSAIETIVEIWDWMVGELAKSDIGKALIDSWGAVSEFFSDMWTSIIDTFTSGLDKVADTIADLKRLANSFVGIQLFDDPEKDRPFIEHIPDQRGINKTLGEALRTDRLRGLNTTVTEALRTDPLRGVNEALDSAGVEPPRPINLPPAAPPAPQIVDTRTERLERTILESRETSEIEVKVSASPGTSVDSVKATGTGKRPRVTSSGDL